MGIFFKDMSQNETENWKKGCYFGFYVFLITLFVNQTYYYIFTSYLWYLLDWVVICIRLVFHFKH